jgi:hypothetical protein
MSGGWSAVDRERGVRQLTHTQMLDWLADHLPACTDPA